ncbi:LPS-assembly protein LptD [Candidatus Pelagibacter sp.]|uniref:LPS-assembly protein LptD n=1 Tax=Candidatus Pelagibacter sp. TaxID=2024849 RepID=UPI003F833C1F
MKSSILIILIIFYQILFLNKSFGKEIEFDASDIEISNNQNLTVANNGTAKIKDDGIIIEGVKIEYLKDKSLIIVSKGKITKVDISLEIKSDTIRYQIKDEKINFENKVRIHDKKNNLIIFSDKINYDLNNQKILGEDNIKIIDEFENNYMVNSFEYSIKDKVIKFSNAKVSDRNKNTFELEIAYLDLIKKEILAKDIGLNFRISENSENEPRLKGRSLTSDQKNTTVKKGTFTFCKKREKCPPWEMSADEIRHDKEKKIIYYKDASLKIYDKKIFYFPRFFHPDPTVKRQTGFLIPRLQENSTTGLSLKLPYFMALAKNKDMTLSPRFFNDDKFLLQSEFRQKNKKSDHIADLSQFVSTDKSSKGHLFYNFKKNYESENFDDIELGLKLEQVTDDTYLKAFKIESPIINNTTNIVNSINLNLYNENQSINTNLNIYEDLSKTNNDRYEYVPNFSFSKIISDNYSFRSKGYYKNYNTNITEKVLINDLEFNSNPKYLNNGILNNKKLLIKNVNSEARNSNKFKNKDTSTLVPTFQTNYTYPLQKQTEEFNYTLTPKFTLNLSTPHTKDVHKNNAKINYNNIYDINRLGLDEINEGGVSITYGYEYTKTNRTNFNQKIKFGFANNLRFEENKDLPANTNLGDKVSDFVGLFEYNPNKNIKLDYNFSLKNNLVDQNYELFGFEYYLKNLTTKFEYLNENNSVSKTSYLKNETQYAFNERNSLIFETRENKEKNFTEYYNLIYQFQNDCLTAAIEFNKEYYSDQDLKPSENLFFKLSILPFGGFNTPNLK